MPLLAMVLTSLISSFLARLFLGAGLTFITFSWVSEILDGLIEKVDDSLNNIPDFALAFAKLWTIDLCLSMILSTIQIIILINVARVIIGKQ